MTAEVRRLFTLNEAGEHEEVITSIDAGVVLAIGEGCQLTLRTLIDRAQSTEDQAKTLREMLRLGEVEKATHDLRHFEGLRIVQQRALKHAETNMQNVAADQGKRLGEIEIEEKALQGIRHDTAERQEKEFRVSGRRGRFERSPQQLNELTALDRDLEKLSDERKKINDDIDGNRNGLLEQLKRARLDIKTTEEEIAKRRVILGLPSEETAE